MNLLTLENISKQYSERLLLDSVSLSINEGDRIGLIGINGSGKSTLLRLIAGEEAPDAGSVRTWGGIRIEFLRQEPYLDSDANVLDTLFRSNSPQMRLLRDYERVSYALERNPTSSELQETLASLAGEMERSGGWAAEADAKSILSRLGITDFEARVGTLSGGERKRVALARALIDRADLLILDEPTNHIDAETVDWLERYLVSTPGALLMVTHDRYFLDRVANRIVELDRRVLESYPGNYSHYLEMREARHEQLAADEHKRRQLLRRELEWVRRSPMARGSKQKARIQRVEELQQISYDSGRDQVTISLASRRLGTRVLEARGLVKSFGEERVVDGIDFDLERGDRIGILGPNGAGKSTFLDILAGKQQTDEGSVRWGETVKIGYYDQKAEALDESKRLIEFVEDEASLIRNAGGEPIEAAKMLEWFLFPRPMQWGRIAGLSGGERRRLYMLRTLLHQPNVLLLDEPTNDLDIQTLAVLEEFLDAFKGCLIVISHDRYFLDRTVDYLYAYENGQLGRRLPAPYDLFQELRRRDETSAPDPEPPRSASAPQQTRPARNESRRLSWKENKELEALELKIEDWEGRRDTLQQEINAQGTDYLKIQRLADELKQVEGELDQAVERWSELAERVG